MTTAPNLIRTLLVAAVCMVAFAVCAPASFGQVVSDPPPPAESEVGAPVDPPVVADPPAEEPAVVDPPADPPAAPEPAPDPPVVPEPAPEPQVVADPPPADGQDRFTTHDENASRWDTARESAQPATQTPTLTPALSDALPVAAPLPTASAGEDFTWTEKGDAFIFETGGSDGGHPTAVLASLSHFGSIASAAVGIPALDARERAARQAAQASTGGSGLVLVDRTGNAMLFFNLFGGGGGGGAALVMLTVLGIVTFYRLMPPDGTRPFRNSTAVWRPSAYDPPIEHPG